MAGFDEVVTLLSELLSVKTNPDTRQFLLTTSERLRGGGGISPADGTRVRRLAGTYAGKLRELREARERARRTNGRRREGLSQADVDERVAARERADSELGF